MCDGKSAGVALKYGAHPQLYFSQTPHNDGRNGAQQGRDETELESGGGDGITIENILFIVVEPGLERSYGLVPLRACCPVWQPNNVT